MKKKFSQLISRPQGNSSYDELFQNPPAGLSLDLLNKMALTRGEKPKPKNQQGSFGDNAAAVQFYGSANPSYGLGSALSQYDIAHSEPRAILQALDQFPKEFFPYKEGVDYPQNQWKENKKNQLQYTSNNNQAQEYLPGFSSTQKGKDDEKERIKYLMNNAQTYRRLFDTQKTGASLISERQPCNYQDSANCERFLKDFLPTDRHLYHLSEEKGGITDNTPVLFWEAYQNQLKSNKNVELEQKREEDPRHLKQLMSLQSKPEQSLLQKRQYEHSSFPSDYDLINERWPATFPDFYKKYGQYVDQDRNFTKKRGEINEHKNRVTNAVANFDKYKDDFKPPKWMNIPKKYPLLKSPAPELNQTKIVPQSQSMTQSLANQQTSQLITPSQRIAQSSINQQMSQPIVNTNISQVIPHVPSQWSDSDRLRYQQAEEWGNDAGEKVRKDLEEKYKDVPYAKGGFISSNYDPYLNTGSSSSGLGSLYDYINHRYYAGGGGVGLGNMGRFFGLYPSGYYPDY